jgi:pimeloyl-ACP methyl ester carboxylesterase
MRLNPLAVVGALFGWGADKTSRLVEHRRAGNDAVLVLLHGFSGAAAGTWAELVPALLRNEAISTWDIWGIGYPSTLRVDIPRVWAADPPLNVLSKSLASRLRLSPLDRYKCVAIAAHSMGGLVAQRALLDDNALAKRISHVFLFGTPSAGLAKALLLGGLKRQIRDMRVGGGFVTTLRRDWSDRFGELPPFAFYAVGGDRDEFVPAASSISPFHSRLQEVIEGDHLGMIRPGSEAHGAVRLIIDSLSGKRHVRPRVDGARLAIELGQFREAIEMLTPVKDEIDEVALGSLALALESVGRQDEALAVLASRNISSSDAFGILAGRLKRRWLVQRTSQDLEAAATLYRRGYQIASRAGDHEQAFYHAINIAFLAVVSQPTASSLPDEAVEMAQTALAHCDQAKDSHWARATRAEASLVLRRLNDAIEHYESAISATTSPRHVQSMYVNAARLAEHIYGLAGLQRVENAFGTTSPS